MIQVDYQKDLKLIMILYRLGIVETNLFSEVVRVKIQVNLQSLIK